MEPVHLSEVLPTPFNVKPGTPQTLDELIRVFDAEEAQANPDAVVSARNLRLTTDGTLAIDTQPGTFAFTDWSKKQLASLVGVNWGRWFASASPTDRADEINKRLWAMSSQLRIRTSRKAPQGNGASGTLRAIVSPAFTPLPNSLVGRLLKTALERVETVIRVTQYAATDKGVSFALGVGQPLRSESSEVGDLWGTLTVLNSDVGFRAASLWASLVRLACKNGLILPVPDSLIFKRAHRGFDGEKLATVLVERLSTLPGKLRTAARILDEARSVRITDAEAVFRTILEMARVPLRFLPEVARAYAEEPAVAPSAFAVSQAITRAAQRAEPEQRFELERAASRYLLELFGSPE